MTWVRFDDGMPLHPKVLGLSDGAYRLWTNGLAFANRAVTDGRIPASIVPTLDHRRAWTRRQIDAFAREIVGVGLWRERPDGYEIHGYAEYQEEALKSSVETRKAGARERKRRQREREKLARSGPGHGVTGRDKQRDTERDMSRDASVTDRVTSAVTEHGTPLSFLAAMSQPPVPSRPDPSCSLLEERGGESAQAPIAAPGSPKARSPEARREALEAAEAEAAALAEGIPPALLARTRQGLAESSPSGKLTPIAWRNALRSIREAAERHGAGASTAVLESLEVYADRYAGQRGVPYLVGIVRGWQPRGAAPGPFSGRRGGMVPPSPPSAFRRGGTPDEELDELWPETRKDAAHA